MQPLGPPTPCQKPISTWRFTFELMAVYIAVFEMWRLLPRPLIIASAIVVAAGCALRMLIVGKSGTTFLGSMDKLLHASVILDILLEGLLIPEHTNRGFYLCAAAFLIVIWAYRRTLQNRVPPGQTPQILGVDPRNPA